MIDFFAECTIGAEEFDAGLAKLRMMYKEPANEVLYNLLGSHDTPRFLTLCQGDVRRMMLAVTFQMTYPGMPVIYYGDERGMIGGNDPDSRRAMDWGELKGQRKELFELYKKLIALRKSNPALKTGDFVTYFVGQKNNVYSYLRRSDDQGILVILNNSEKTRKIAIRSPENWKNSAINLLGGEKYEIVEGRIIASLKPYTGLILRPTDL